VQGIGEKGGDGVGRIRGERCRRRGPRLAAPPAEAGTHGGPIDERFERTARGGEREPSRGRRADGALPGRDRAGEVLLGAPCGGPGVGAQPADHRDLVVDAAGQLLQGGAERRPRARGGPLDDGARLVPAGGGVEPLAQLLHELPRQRSVVRRDVGDGEDGRESEADAVEHCQEVGPDGGARLGGNPVEDHPYLKPPLPGPDQVRPGDPVAVPRRRGHEEPEVGSLEEDVRHRPVGRLERVHVRCVQDDQPGGYGRDGDGVGEVTQRDLVDGGVMGDHGPPRRRPQHARGRDLATRERVQDRGLPDPGGTAEDDDGGRRVVGETRKEVGTDLGGHPRPGLAHLRRSRDVEGEGGRRHVAVDVVEQVEQRRGRLGCTPPTLTRRSTSHGTRVPRGGCPTKRARRARLDWATRRIGARPP